MQLLLPPSETKRSGGGSAFQAELLVEHAVLGATRTRVREALEELSRDADAAARALKLGVKSRHELAHNLELGTSGVMPAIERYTGVLYDALFAVTLDVAARQWMQDHVAVQSALFGLLSADDPIPAYRLSAGTRLPALGASLKQVWRSAHTGVDWAARGWILDLRSQDYVELAPLPDGAGDALLVAQRGPGGQVRALNHFNKAAKGDLVRRLALAQPDIADRADFVAWAADAGLEVHADGPTLTLVTELGAPRSGAVAAR